MYRKFPNLSQSVYKQRVCVCVFFFFKKITQISKPVYKLNKGKQNSVTFKYVKKNINKGRCPNLKNVACVCWYVSCTGRNLAHDDHRHSDISMSEFYEIFSNF